MELCSAAFSGIFFGIFYRYKCLLANKLKLCVVKIYSKTNGKEFRINYNLNCNTENVVYLITCRVCGIQYVGSTTTTFRSRFNNPPGGDSHMKQTGMLVGNLEFNP